MMSLLGVCIMRLLDAAGSARLRRGSDDARAPRAPHRVVIAGETGEEAALVMPSSDILAPARHRHRVAAITILKQAA